MKDRDTAKDIVQDVFIALWNKRNNLDIKTSIEAYLLRAVKFKSIDFIRKEKQNNNMSLMCFQKMNFMMIIMKII